MFLLSSGLRGMKQREGLLGSISIQDMIAMHAFLTCLPCLTIYLHAITIYNWYVPLIGSKELFGERAAMAPLSADYTGSESKTGPIFRGKRKRKQFSLLHLLCVLT